MSCCSGPAEPNRRPEAVASASVAGTGDGRNIASRNVIWLDGGKSFLGTDRPEHAADGEGPERPVRLQPFGLSAHAVTNAEFAAFIAATGYRTDAERFGWSFVFGGLIPGTDAPRPQGLDWWVRIDGADWQAPLGPGSSAAERPDHPAVHISWTDAAAFAAWAGGRLPSEAEWEFAARGGNDHARYPWGNDEPTDEAPRCNIWQGSFPDLNTVRDGFFDTAPVDAFAANSFGFRNMSGNVWEWCADAFRVRSLTKSARARNDAATRESERVLKGGSYLCHRSYCWRYRIAARSGRSADTSAGHTGFRVAFDRA